MKKRNSQRSYNTGPSAVGLCWLDTRFLQNLIRFGEERRHFLTNKLRLNDQDYHSYLMFFVFRSLLKVILDDMGCSSIVCLIGHYIIQT